MLKDKSLKKLTCRIFKMTENGFTSKDFHNYCDNKGATLILIKTSNDGTALTLLLRALKGVLLLSFIG